MALGNYKKKVTEAFEATAKTWKVLLNTTHLGKMLETNLKIYELEEEIWRSIVRAFFVEITECIANIVVD